MEQLLTLLITLINQSQQVSRLIETARGEGRDVTDAEVDALLSELDDSFAVTLVCAALADPSAANATAVLDQARERLQSEPSWGDYLGYQGHVRITAKDGPVALGWLRVSHRELDKERTTSWQPVLAHRRELKLAPGEIVRADIEIWPSGTRFEAGESLRLVVQGRDIYDYPKPSVYARHEETVNAGNHVLHTGGRYDARLLVPVVPA